MEQTEAQQEPLIRQDGLIQHIQSLGNDDIAADTSSGDREQLDPGTPVPLSEGNLSTLIHEHSCGRSSIELRKMGSGLSPTSAPRASSKPRSRRGSEGSEAESDIDFINKYVTCNDETSSRRM